MTALVAPVAPAPVALDVRKIDPAERPAMVFAAFGLLQSGQSLELASERPLKALRTAFESDQPGRFAWVELEQGPAVWRAAITRVQAGRGHGGGSGCCGGCGGA